MSKKDSSKLNEISKLPWLRISIIILGFLVIFGLGFALGIHYAQNLYLNGNKSVQSSLIYGKEKEDKVKSDDKFTFYDQLKRSAKKDIKGIESSVTSIGEPKKPETERDSIKESQKEAIDTSSSRNGYTIQVYSFKSKDISERMVAELMKKGYPAYQSTIDLGKNGLYYRVRIGHYKNRSEASRVLEVVLEAENREAFITRD